MKKGIKTKGFFTYLRKTYRFAKKSKKNLIFMFIGCIIYCVVSILSPLLTARRIVALTSSLWQRLILITFVILFVEFVRNFIRFCNNYFMDRFYFAIKKNIQSKLTKETLKIDMHTLNNNSSGLFIERINEDTNTLADAFNIIVDNGTFCLSNIGILISMFFLNKIIFFIYCLFLIMGKNMQQIRF